MNHLFNLSKTEFAAYLECPIKFYLVKQQNLYTEEGPRGRKRYSSYKPHLLDGIEKHHLLTDFLQDHGKDLMLGNAPPAIVHSKPILRLFWEQERHRFEVDPENWLPLAYELYLRTETMRGKIDRVDPIDEHSCRIVEYKSSPQKSGFLDEELLFYALLATDCPDFSQQFGLTVTEVACYFYSTGEWFSREVTSANLKEFRAFLKSIRQDILTGNWSTRHACHLLSSECDYAVVCTKIPEKLLKGT